MTYPVTFILNQTRKSTLTKTRVCQLVYHTHLRSSVLSGLGALDLHSALRYLDGPTNARLVSPKRTKSSTVAGPHIRTLHPQIGQMLSSML